MSSDNLLYHYTNAAGLTGILSNKKVWMTYIHALNDSLEESHALSVMVDYFELRYKSVEDKLRKLPKPTNECDPLEQSGYGYELSTLRNLIKQFQNGDFYSDDSETFTFSLSEDKDSLSQWRGYGLGGGYAIEFCRDDLYALCKSEGCILDKCEYDLAKQKEKIKELLDPLFESKSNSRHQSYSASRFDGILFEVLSKTREIRPLFKKSSFSEENEWRIILFRDRGSVKFPMLYRTNASYITPYVELEMKTEIKELMIGPGIDFIRAKKPLGILIKDKNLLKGDVSKITQSKSSYRL